MNVEAFERNIEATRTALRDSVMSISIWSSDTGLILADWQGNSTAVALFTQLFEHLDELLQETVGDATQAGDYLYIELEEDKSLVIINHGNALMQGWLLDTTKVKPGVVLGMALPSAVKNLSNIS